ncbi:MAG: UPF0182 family protein, partial [Actinomycetota bacterium]
QNMVAWMAARSDPQDYGQVKAYEFPGGENIDGPVQVFNQMLSFPQFSAQQTLLSQGGSEVLFGNFLVIPLEQSFLYVQPVFVQSNQPDAFPVLKRVVVFHGGTVGLGSTLQEAIADSFQGVSTGTGGQGQKGQQGNTSQQIQSLLNAALQHFAKANAALQAGNLGQYQSELTKAQGLVKQANELVAKLSSGGGGGGSGGGSSSSPSTTPSVPATPSPSATPSTSLGP